MVLTGGPVHRPGFKMCSKYTSESMEHEDAYHTYTDQRVIQSNEMWMLLLIGYMRLYLDTCMFKIQDSNPGVSNLKFTIFLFSFLNYESMITHLQETWKIQNKVTQSYIIQYVISFFFFYVVYLFGCSGSQLQHVGSSSLTRDQTWAPCTQSLSHWTTREVPKMFKASP